MINIIKKELIIYVTILIVLMLLMHPDLLFNPSERLSNMKDIGNFAHPLLYTFIIYMIVYFLRVLFSFIKRLFTKK